MSLKYFSPLKDSSIDWDKVHPEALLMLDNARDIAGIPFVITSNWRSQEHTLEVGGIKNDSHTEDPCTAFDIAATNSTERFKIISALMKAGFVRIGISTKNNHIHVDASKKLPQNVFWVE